MHPLAHLKALNFAVTYCPPSGEHPDRERLGAGHERCELITAGRGWVESGRDWIEVTAGSLVWNIGGDYTIGRSDLANPFRCLAIDFAVSRRGRRSAPRFSRWDHAEEREHFVRRIARLAADPQGDRLALGTYLYATLLLQARAWERFREQPTVPEPVRMAQRILDGRYAEDLDIPSLAKRVGWSPSHLHAEFRRHCGTTPHQYLIRRRVQAVCEALLKQGHGLEEIALVTGFPDARTLVRSFRRQMGTSPMRWRARPAAP